MQQKPHLKVKSLAKKIELQQFKKNAHIVCLTTETVYHTCRERMQYFHPNLQDQFAIGRNWNLSTSATNPILQ